MHSVISEQYPVVVQYLQERLEALHERTLVLENVHLRAAASDFRESRDNCHSIDFLIFFLKDPNGELASNITFKSSADFLF